VTSAHKMALLWGALARSMIESKLALEVSEYFQVVVVLLWPVYQVVQASLGLVAVLRLMVPLRLLYVHCTD